MEITFCCSSRDKSLKAKTEYRNQSVSVNCDMDFKAGAPIINAAAVLGYNGTLKVVSGICNEELCPVGYKLRAQSKLWFTMVKLL